MPIATQNWDAPTPPAIPSGWTVSGSLQTSAAASGVTPTSSPNMLRTTTTSATWQFATFGTQDGNGGDVTVQASFSYSASTGSHKPILGVAARGSAATLDTSSTSWYGAYLDPQAETANLIKYSAGTLTTLGSLSLAGPFSVAAWYVVTLTLSGTSSTIASITITRTSDGDWINASGNWVNGTPSPCLTVTDSSSPITGQGYSGLFLDAATGFAASDDWSLSSAAIVTQLYGADSGAAADGWLFGPLAADAGQSPDFATMAPLAGDVGSAAESVFGLPFGDDPGTANSAAMGSSFVGEAGTALDYRISCPLAADPFAAISQQWAAIPVVTLDVAATIESGFTTTISATGLYTADAGAGLDVAWPIGGVIAELVAASDWGGLMPVPPTAGDLASATDVAWPIGGVAADLVPAAEGWCRGSLTGDAGPFVEAAAFGDRLGVDAGSWVESWLVTTVSGTNLQAADSGAGADATWLVGLIGDTGSPVETGSTPSGSGLISVDVSAAADWSLVGPIAAERVAAADLAWQSVSVYDTDSLTALSAALPHLRDADGTPAVAEAALTTTSSASSLSADDATMTGDAGLAVVLDCGSGTGGDAAWWSATLVEADGGSVLEWPGTPPHAGSGMVVTADAGLFDDGYDGSNPWLTLVFQPGYLLYTNHGTGPIDYSWPIAVIYGWSTTTWTSAPLNVPATWGFGLRAMNTFGEEENLDASVFVQLSATGTDISALPPPPVGLRAFSQAGGAIKVEWTTRQPTYPSKPATQFFIYAGTSGTPNYGSPVATVQANTAILGIFAFTLTGLVNGDTYTIGVRAGNASGIEQNVVTVSAVSEATGPGPVSGLSAVAIV